MEEMTKHWVVTVSFGELILKGRNRHIFVKNAEKQIKKAIKDFDIKKTYSELGMYFIELGEDQVAGVVEAVQKVFGIVYVTPTLRVAQDLEVVKETAIEMMKGKLREIKEADPSKKTVTFKVEGKRADKTFPLNSMEVARQIGGDVLEGVAGEEMLPELKVDVHNPEIRLWVDIRDQAYIYMDRYPGLGGLPWGSGGKALLLLSGGIDSPVAGFNMARRGLELGAIHFHSYPFTSERAQDKAVRLAKKMSVYCGPMKLFMVNLIDSYTAINKSCRAKNTTVLSRRMMMRIAERISETYEYAAFITGESLGQVASQTLQGLQVVDEVAKKIVLRPLIAMDKTDIIRIADDIDTYETSIEPYDDCCSIFAPDHPNTNPKSKDLEEDEKALDIEDLVKKALASVEIIEIE